MARAMTPETDIGTTTVRQVWETYQHLDHLLRDPEWLPNTIQGNLLRVFWQAIRHQEAPKET